MTDTAFQGFARIGAQPAASFTLAHDARMDWRPAPIDPAWILAGTPRAAYIPLASGHDGYSSVSLWRCTEGRFRWTFGWEETVYILKGEVEVTDAAGNEGLLRAGSVALFQGGSTAIWNVVEPVEKMAVCRRAMSPRLASLLRFARRPWSLAIAALVAAGERLTVLEPLLA